MAGWHHPLNGCEFEQAPGDSEGWGSLSGCSSWGRRVGHDSTTEQQQCRHLLELRVFCSSILRSQE